MNKNMKCKKCKGMIAFICFLLLIIGGLLVYILLNCVDKNTNNNEKKTTQFTTVDNQNMVEKYDLSKKLYKYRESENQEFEFNISDDFYLKGVNKFYYDKGTSDRYVDSQSINIYYKGENVYKVVLNENEFEGEDGIVLYRVEDVLIFAFYLDQSAFELDFVDLSTKTFLKKSYFQNVTRNDESFNFYVKNNIIKFNVITDQDITGKCLTDYLEDNFYNSSFELDLNSKEFKQISSSVSKYDAAGMSTCS